MLDYGELTEMVRVVAGGDYLRAQEISRTWPTREVCVSYLYRLQDDARRSHEVATLVWASLAPHSKNRKPPKAPEILDG